MVLETVTLNPATDVYYTSDELLPYSENRVRFAGRFSGGKGINVSSALASYGVPCRTFALLGGDNLREYLSHLPELSVEYEKVSGRIRENITVISARGETRISAEGAAFDEKSSDRLFSRIYAAPDAVVAVCGSLPAGSDKRFFIEKLKDIKSRGAKLILDSSSFSADEIKEIYPYLIKPNKYEFKTLFGREFDEDAPPPDGAETAENIVVSLGGRGACFLSRGTKAFIMAPQVTALSTVGAGDSLVAGIMAGLYEKKSLVDALCLGTAFGCAACEVFGTVPPEKRRILEIYKQIKKQKE